MSLFDLIEISSGRILASTACIGHLFNNIKRAEERAGGAVSQCRRIGDVEKRIHLVLQSPFWQAQDTCGKYWIFGEWMELNVFTSKRAFSSISASGTAPRDLAG